MNCNIIRDAQNDLVFSTKLIYQQTDITAHTHIDCTQAIATVLCKVHYLYFTLFLRVKASLLQHLN